MVSFRALMSVRGPEGLVASSTPVHCRFWSSDEEGRGEEEGESMTLVHRVLSVIVRFGRRRTAGGRYAVAAELPTLIDMAEIRKSQ